MIPVGKWYKVEVGEFYIWRILSIRQIRQNKMLANIGSARNVDIITELMRRYCLCHLVFNLESVQITKTDLNNLHSPLYRAFTKIFNVRDRANIVWCQLNMRQLPINYLLEKLSIIKKLFISKCYLMQHLYNYTVRGRLDAKYGLQANTTVSKLLSTLWSQFHSELIWIYFFLHALRWFRFCCIVVYTCKYLSVMVFFRLSTLTGEIKIYIYILPAIQYIIPTEASHSRNRNHQGWLLVKNIKS